MPEEGISAELNFLSSIRAKPGSTNTVPGEVIFSLDIRAGEDKLLQEVEEQLRIDFDRIVNGAPVEGLNDGAIPGQTCSVEWTLDAPSPAIKFDRHCIDCIRHSAEVALEDYSANLIQDMTSGAGEAWPEAQMGLQMAECWTL